MKKTKHCELWRTSFTSSTLFVYCLAPLSLSLSLSLLVLFGHRIDDRNELVGLQAATANKEAIDIGLLGQVVAVLRFDRPCKGA